jgi:hypothetical protein
MCITYKIITLDNYITNIPTPVLSIILAVKTRCICIKKKLLNISAKDILKRTEPDGYSQKCTRLDIIHYNVYHWVDFSVGGRCA